MKYLLIAMLLSGCFLSGDPVCKDVEKWGSYCYIPYPEYAAQGYEKQCGFHMLESCLEYAETDREHVYHGACEREHIWVNECD